MTSQGKTEYLHRDGFLETVVLDPAVDDFYTEKGDVVLEQWWQNEANRI